MSDARSVGRLDGVAQAALVHNGEVKPTELVEWALERAEQLNPALNAIVIPMDDYAKDLAAEAQGPLRGVPMVLKDLVVEVPGVAITEGSRFVSGVVSKFESELVARYRRAGLVAIGKTNTPEFGMAPYCDNEVFGATRNPWNLDHTTAGSSGGSAAAVAAGIVPIGHASDAGGSIRYPASCCGLFGLKTTRARNPLGPEYGEALGGAAVEHVVTRSVRDSAAALDATSGPAAGDPYWAPPPARAFLTEVGTDPGRLRIAYSRVSAENTPLHPDCVAALDHTLRVLDGLGHELVEAPFEPIDEATGNAIGVVMNASAAWILKYWERRLGRAAKEGDLEPWTAALCEGALSISASAWLLAKDDINAYSRRAAGFFDTYDLFCCPTVTTPPPTLAGIRENPGEMIRNAGVIANLTGNPAMSVPLFWTGDGLPIGSHFLARFGEEATLLRLASQLEAADPWADRWPSFSAG